MGKIKLHYLVGSVHLGGHDVEKVAENNRRMLETAEAFDILMVCDNPRIGDTDFETYLKGDDMAQCQVFVFDCGNYRFNIKSEQQRFEYAVAAGAGCVFLHGQQVCYWKEAGMAQWDEIEKMQGLLWREQTRHGDYADAHIVVKDRQHPIMQGLSDFDTRDEIFCRCENVHNVPVNVLAAAYSDPAVVSRHGLKGTGEEEPVAVTGMYGKGRIYSQLLGHVWPCYTGHGLGENTMLSYRPVQLRQMFVRACEWAASGKVEKTLVFDKRAGK